VDGDGGASLRLNDYQAEAQKTDRAADKTLAFPLLGLFGEVGTLLSVVKKKQRDASSYIGYRFHDVFHYAYAAVLTWSPVTRSLLRLKRKSKPKIDEVEDGARATLIEEGIATSIFGQAKQLDFFAGLKRGDLSFDMLKAIRQFVAGYEAQRCPLWLWEDAILQGYEAFRFLRKHRRARLTIDMGQRKLLIGDLPRDT